MTSSSSSSSSSLQPTPRYSLRARLLSAVDLPPSLSPALPLCPWFKLGLVEDVHDHPPHQQQPWRQHNDKSLYPQWYHSSENHTTTTNSNDVPVDADNSGTGDDKDENNNRNDNNNNDEENNERKDISVSALLKNMSSVKSRTSTVKIMSKPANGGGGNGADWNEEFRWDDLDHPLDTALVLKLFTLLAPDNSDVIVNKSNSSSVVPSGAIQGGSTHGSTHYDGSDTTNTTVEEPFELSSPILGAGFKGLWRKGRQQLEEHRNRSRTTGNIVSNNTTASGTPLTIASNTSNASNFSEKNSREEKAAAVAQFLMNGSSLGVEDEAISSSISSSHQKINLSLESSSQSIAATAQPLLRQQDFVAYHQKWNVVKKNIIENEQERTLGQELSDHNGNSDVSDAVALVKSKSSKQVAYDDDAECLCLGTLIIPLSRLPLEEAFGEKSSAVMERWYQLDEPNHGSVSPSGSTSITGNKDNETNESATSVGILHGPRRCPSVLLELTFATADYLDDAEDEILVESDIHEHRSSTTILDLGGLCLEDETDSVPVSPKAAAAVVEEKSTPKDEPTQKKIEDRSKLEEPELVSGILDFVCIVGARDIGNQRNDDGSKGWVQSTPECCVLERFPPDDEFHRKNGRNAALIPQVEWFCFPEGCKLWRGARAPTYDELKAGGVTNMARYIDSSSAFESCLGSASSFSWFVLSSNSDSYGSKLVKTYGAVVRFYVPAPIGIDPTQDDFAQTMTGESYANNASVQKGGKTTIGQKRLWVPIGICLLTTLPIIGVMEEILLRMCFAMSSNLSSSNDMSSKVQQSFNRDHPNVVSKLYDMLQQDLFHLIVNFSQPIPGVVHCSIPFLDGERLHVTTAPHNGLPSLPHGGAIASTCRLLGAEGLTLLLAATLTECKILLHSFNVANLSMVAEVISALIFPFTWQLPYIPVLPKDMLEFLEAPLSFFVGIPTCNLKYCDKNVLSEIVVVDLDDIVSSTDYEGRRGPRTKIPSALPASVSSSISKAVFRLLREEQEIDDQMNAATFPGCRRSSRLENESMAERYFRIHVAIQICSLVRGYQDCLFFVSASQPVFNRDRFLRQAPALFEDKRPTVLIDSNYSDRTQRILSPRSKRFLSVLVNAQHFHQLLERLSSEETSFFHEVMESIEYEDDARSGVKNHFCTNFGSKACDEVADKLYVALEHIEQKIPTYKIDRERRNPEKIRWQDEDDEFKIDFNFGIGGSFWFEDDEKNQYVSFTFNILKPIMSDHNNNAASSSGGVHALSLEYLVELEKNPWKYSDMLRMSARNGPDSENQEAILEVRKPIKLREAIGERRFRAWKIAYDHKDNEDTLETTPITQKSNVDETLDLSAILLSVPELRLDGSTSSAQPQLDANSRNKVRLCLEKALGPCEDSSIFQENGRNLIEDAEAALRNSSAQRYLFSVLSQRNRIEKQRSRRSVDESKQRTTSQQSISRLEHNGFECIVRLCYAVLEACMEEQNYESAYRLISYTGGFCTTSNTQTEPKTVYMTERIKNHPIFADLRLWERVLLLHHQEQQNDRKEDSTNSEDGEEHSRTEPAESDDTSINDEYDAAVSTLYEMVGYGVPAEELARFATKISEEKGWFATEKGQALLVLARRLTAKRDEEGDKPGDPGDFLLGLGNVSQTRDRLSSKDFTGGGGTSLNKDKLISEVISWAHPSISLFSSDRHFVSRGFLSNMLGSASESHMLGVGDLSNAHQAHGLKETITGGTMNAAGYAGRIAITAMAAFGSTAVVTGGVDGSIFLAHTIHFGADKCEFESHCTSSASCSSPLHSKSSVIKGVKLQCGAKGDGHHDSVCGSISCLAATRGSGYRVGNLPHRIDSHECADEEEIVSSMEGCRIIAGTTCGGLKVWLLKDIYKASCLSRISSNMDSAIGTRSHHGSGTTSLTSTLIRHNADDHGLQDAIKGISIGGHRGGVTAIDVPPPMYRPDTLLSGGEDGLIKLWSLKSSATSAEGMSQNAQFTSIQSRFFSNRQMASITTDYDASDAQGVFTGHEGRIICIKTAWHGDKSLSGGSDKTVRLWDLAGTTKPLATMRGHQGWVTQAHFWGHLVVSASTDRSIALWDIRAGPSPLFALRYHLSPVSDLLLGNRSEQVMVSAGADGSLATWDFRFLSGLAPELTPSDLNSPRTVRSAVVTMNHLEHSKTAPMCGSVKLTRAVGRHDFCYFSICSDGIVNEWDASSGNKISSYVSGQRDAISGFSTFTSNDLLRQGKNRENGAESVGGIITSSWNGTVSVRRLSRKS